MSAALEARVAALERALAALTAKRVREDDRRLAEPLPVALYNAEGLGAFALADVAFVDPAVVAAVAAISSMKGAGRLLGRVFWGKLHRR